MTCVRSWCGLLLALVALRPVQAWQFSSVQRPRHPSPLTATIDNHQDKITTQSATTNTHSKVNNNLSPAGHDHEAWKRGYTTCPAELGPLYLDLNSDNPMHTIPPDFPDGTYYRNGHGRFEANDGVRVHHMFDGDGLVTAVTFGSRNDTLETNTNHHSNKQRSILFRNRFVQTDGYRRDLQTGGMSRPGTFGTRASGGWWRNVCRTDFKNVANTHVHYDDNSDNQLLYALWEGGWPHVLDPLTLATRPTSDPDGDDLNGLLQKGDGFAAHYRYDPVTKRIVNFGVKLDPAAGTTIISLWELDDQLQAIRGGKTNDKMRLIVPGAGVLHDFALTKNWCVFAMPPAALDTSKALQALVGRNAFVEAIAFAQDATESLVYLVPRAQHLPYGTASRMVAGQDDRVRVIRVPYNFNFHFANAYEDENGNVVIDSVTSDKVELGTNMNNDLTVPIWETVRMEELWPSKYTRLVVDPVQKKVVGQPQVLSTREPEFPSIPRELTGRKHRYAYTVGAHQEFDSGKGANGAVLKIDTQAPELNEAYSFLPHEFVGEQVFCAKKGVDVTQPGCEDKGYLVTFVENRRDLTTDLVIFDVEGKGTLEKGPVTRIRLPTYIPPGLHGIFVPGLTFEDDTRLPGGSTRVPQRASSARMDTSLQARRDSALKIGGMRGGFGRRFPNVARGNPYTRGSSLASAATSVERTSQIRQRCDVCVMGGGFGGLYTALQIDALAKRNNQPLDIVLVDPSDRFVFLPLLYDLVEGTATRQEVCPLYRDLLRDTNIRFIQGNLRNVTVTDGPCALVEAEPSAAKSYRIDFQKGVLSVGATPQSILAQVPGAAEHTQPFYTQEHALQTRQLLERLERQASAKRLNIAVVGGGYGGVELAACLQRRFGKKAAQITLLARSPPLQGTRAEPVVDRALEKLGVQVELCGVDAIEPVATSQQEANPFMQPQLYVRRTRRGDESKELSKELDQGKAWDAVFWTAGSSPSEPVSSKDALTELERVNGRLATDATLRCTFPKSLSSSSIASPSAKTQPPIWALGDCAEIIGGVPTPRTAQVAMQQADVVAYNLCLDLGVMRQTARSRRMARPQKFVYRDLGSMIMLGGVDGIVAAPPDSSTLGPVFAPLIDTARIGLGVADSLLRQQSSSSSTESSKPPSLANLSLSGYGLVPNQARGNLAGTLAGAARRAVYAARMPTNRQKAYAAASATLSTVWTLAKEASAAAAAGVGHDGDRDGVEPES